MPNATSVKACRLHGCYSQQQAQEPSHTCVIMAASASSFLLSQNTSARQHELYTDMMVRGEGAVWGDKRYSVILFATLVECRAADRLVVAMDTSDFDSLTSRPSKQLMTGGPEVRVSGEGDHQRVTCSAGQQHMPWLSFQFRNLQRQKHISTEERKILLCMQCPLYQVSSLWCV